MSLGHACINMNLGKQKPKITTNRSMINKDNNPNTLLINFFS